MKSDVSLTEGSIPRALLVFSLPILLGNLLQSVNGSVNAIWFGVGYYRLGGWRKVRLGLARTAPVPSV